MSDEGARPQVRREFGGYCSWIARQALPPTLSPLAENVQFRPGEVGTRDSYSVLLTDTVGIQDFGQFVRDDGTRRTWIFESNGALRYEYPEGTISTITTGLGTNLRMRGETAFNRLMLCASDGQRGVDYPRQWDTQNLDRLSISPPGAGSTLAQVAGGAISVGLHSMVVVFVSRNNAISMPGPPVSITIAPGTNTVNVTNIPTGPPDIVQRRLYWTPAGGGPQFYWIPNDPLFILDDNTTNFKNGVTFTDAVLINDGSNELGRLQYAWPLPASLGLLEVSGRLIAYGIRQYHKMYKRSDNPVVTGWANSGQSSGVGFINLRFDGGFGIGRAPLTGFDGANTPNGWNRQDANSTALPTGATGATGGAMRFDGTGAAATVGTLTYTSATMRSWGGDVVKAGHRYGWRCRIRHNADGDTMRFHLKLTENGGATTLFEATVPSASFTSDWTVIDMATLSGATINRVALPDSAFTLTIEGTYSGAAGSDRLFIDWLEPYDIDDTSPASTIWATDAGTAEQTNAQDGENQVGPGDGQEVRAMFESNGIPYVLKEDSLHSGQNTGDIFSNWSWKNESQKVGTLSKNGVDAGDGFTLILSRSGVYLFSGGEPEELSVELGYALNQNAIGADPSVAGFDWNQIDWTLGERAWIVVDDTARRAHIGVPSRSVLSGGYELTLDYSLGWGLWNGNSGRRWSVVSHNDPEAPTLSRTWHSCGALLERDAGLRIFCKGATTDGMISNSLTDSQGAAAFTYPPWVRSSGPAVTVTAGQTDPYGGTNAVRWQFGAATDVLLATGLTLQPGDYATVSMWMKLLSGAVRFKSTLSTAYQRPRQDGLWGAPLVVTGYNSGANPVTLYVEVVTESSADVHVYGVGAIQSGGGSGGYYGYQAVVGGVPVGDSTSGIIVGEERYPSWVYDNSPKKTYDYAGVIRAAYDTSNFTSDMGNSQFDRVVLRLRGNGVAQSTSVATDDTYNTGKGVMNWTLSNPDKWEADHAYNQIEQAARVRIATAGVIDIAVKPLTADSWWVVRSVGYLKKAAPFMWLRGRS